MTQDEMYDKIRLLMRTGSTDMQALVDVLTECKTEIKPFFRGDEHLYVKVHKIPFKSVQTINFLATSLGFEVEIVAFSIFFGVADDYIPTAFLHIY